MFYSIHLPYICTVLVLLIGDHSLSKQFALEMSLTIVFMKCYINPVVYYWRVSEIRKAMRETVRDCCCSNLAAF